ncbi:MAG: ABC transporter ATP-binding protein [Bifidobacterium sp.]|uniref:ABC transporter ATP-binding protein n=1 Tax=Bifidobacterium fermentum TaxID=3059035 RepID=A0AB39UKK0_9BIFI
MSDNVHGQIHGNALTVRDVDVRIASHPILDSVSLDVAPHERVGLIGSSGSGKSMLARAILGLLPANAHAQGSIDLFGDELIGASEREMADLRGRIVSVVFQNPAVALNPVMKVGKQIELPLRLHYDIPAHERLHRVQAMLDKVGLPHDVLNVYPHELSGGQQQRVAIATALITSPRFIIADEPTTALDSITQLHIIDVLVELVDRAGASLLFITHDFGVLAHATQRCYVIDRGRVVESGPTKQLLSNPKQSVTRQLAESAEELKFNGLRADLDETNGSGDDE